MWILRSTHPVWMKQVLGSWKGCCNPLCSVCSVYAHACCRLFVQRAYQGGLTGRGCNVHAPSNPKLRLHLDARRLRATRPTAHSSCLVMLHVTACSGHDQPFPTVRPCYCFPPHHLTPLSLAPMPPCLSTAYPTSTTCHQPTFQQLLVE
jgi:hypothetical protein